MVELLEPSFLVPCEDTPKGRLWLSNLDQVSPHTLGGFVYFYKKTNATDFFSVEVLKATLSKTLVLFYPLAGRQVVGSDGRAELDCNAEGCLFVSAKLERSFDSINFQLWKELEDLFIPSIEMAGSPFIMLMIQVTHLKCGGVVVGFAFNHVFVDGRSSLHFIRTWAGITRGDMSSVISPSFDLTQLHARSPPIANFHPDEYTCETIKPTQTGSTTTKFSLSKVQVSHLKSRCCKGSVTRISSFCAVVSLVWKCFCVAQGLAPDTTAQIMFTVDIRDRLKPPLPKHHFSNAVVRRSVQSEVSKITSSPLHVVAKIVKAAIASVDDEYVRSSIDYAEIMGNEVFGRKGVPASHLRFVSISGLPVYDADFGWGAPQLVSRWQVGGNRFVYISDEPGENGGKEIFVTVDSATMCRFEKMFYEELNADNENNSLIGMEISPKYQISRSNL
ncbi:HXXXD-type acyl-transferase family protein [Rhynchospora pubera]|uniref:HXXXD-type acyl-transferase family protein n=1 Tax=Rhynchospora pubera TaxID=906938 RepID=A0AAV8EIB9_9POAL|nr:HXXXD-type acyl-transferase family protein [Rhynchospora pubera]KAJ4786226.1 HXXXD-type acyl-transferase family protein [Rhynchospora pubera]